MKNFFNAFLGPLKIYVFRKFHKFHSPNQLKYLMATSVKLVHTFNKSFSMRLKTRPSITDEDGSFFEFFTF
jgi:hypothetical protein